jgi:hypothetical protein
MTFETIGFPLVFIVLITILLWILTDAKGKWWVKTIVITLTLSLSLVVWNSVEGMLGWATNQQIIGEHQLHWAIVEEPSKKTQAPGGIYLLVEKKEVVKGDSNFVIYKSDKKEPRLYRIKYTKKMHKEMQKAQEMLKKGKKVMIKGDKKGAKGEKGEKGKEGKDGKNGEKGYEYENDYELRIYQLPPAKPPSKIYLQN